MNKAIHAHQRLLVHYVAGIVGDLEVAREIVQEGFLRLWKMDENAVQVTMERAWLLRVCRNLAIDTRRRSSKVVAVADVEARAGAAPEPSSIESELEQVLAVVATLSPAQQDVVRLRYQQGLAYKEIAAVTGHSVSNVGVLLHEALKKVRVRIEEDQGALPAADAKGRVV